MGASVAIELRKKPLKDGTYPLAVRITKDRKPSYKQLGKSIEKKYWDDKAKKVKSSHPNSVRFNNWIKKKLTEAEDVLLKLEGDKTDTSATQIKNKIYKKDDKAYFFVLSKEYMDELEELGKWNQVSANRTKFKHFKEFLREKKLLENDDILVNKIDYNLLEKYIVFLKVQYGNGKTSIYNKLNVIRIVWNMTRRKYKKRKDIQLDNYPFGGGKDGIEMKPAESQKIGLTKEEIKLIENADLIEGSGQWHARNVYLFSFYHAGMRVGDTLLTKWSDIVDGRLHYEMGKNGKRVSVKIPDKALDILEHYKYDKRHEKDLVFPDIKKANLNDSYDVYRKICTAAKSIGDHLKNLAESLGIEKNISMHISRHSFGNISKGTIPTDVLQTLYRHSHITTTQGYQNNFIHEKEDAALNEVINF